MSDETTIASRLRTALEHRGMGVREFQREMEALGVEGSSYPAINRALHARVIPSVPFLESAADLLNVPRAWLITGDYDKLMPAADAIVRAMTDPGSHPEYHYRQMTRLKDEWPVLYEAIAELMAARGWPDLERKLRDSL